MLFFKYRHWEITRKKYYFFFIRVGFIDFPIKSRMRNGIWSPNCRIIGWIQIYEYYLFKIQIRISKYTILLHKYLIFEDILIFKKLLLSRCINFNNWALTTQNFNNILRLWLAIMWPFNITLQKNIGVW